MPILFFKNKQYYDGTLWKNNMVAKYNNSDQ